MLISTQTHHSQTINQLSAEGDMPEVADVWSFVIETRIFIEFNSEQTTVESRALKTKGTD